MRLVALLIVLTCLATAVRAGPERKRKREDDSESDDGLDIPYDTSDDEDESRPQTPLQHIARLNLAAYLTGANMLPATWKHMSEQWRDIYEEINDVLATGEDRYRDASIEFEHDALRMIRDMNYGGLVLFIIELYGRLTKRQRKRVRRWRPFWQNRNDSGDDGKGPKGPRDPGSGDGSASTIVM